jgi:hypothetical protein
MFDAVETFEFLEAAECVDASDVYNAELVERVSTPASSPMRDDEFRVAANSFDQGESRPSRNISWLYMYYISELFASKKTME